MHLQHIYEKRCLLGEWKLTDDIVNFFKSIARLLFTFHRFAILLQVQFQRLHIVVKAQRGHGKQNVLTVDGFPLFSLTPVRSLWRDEGNELGNTLLNAFSSILGNFALGEKLDTISQMPTSTQLTWVGMAFFMIRATLAMGKNRSCSLNSPPSLLSSWCSSSSSCDDRRSWNNNNFKFVRQLARGKLCCCVYLMLHYVSLLSCRACCSTQSGKRQIFPVIVHDLISEPKFALTDANKVTQTKTKNMAERRVKFKANQFSKNLLEINFSW